MNEPRLVAGRYQVLGALGRGGMGEVWLAHDQRLDTKVAIKRVPPELADSAELKESLQKEARILAKLNDPRIVRLFDLADCEDGLLMVIEYVCGPSLQQMLKARVRFNETELRHVMRDVCGGLEVAHGQGVLHRDLKPANLLVALPESARRAFVSDRVLPADILDCRTKVTDFGIAKVMEGTASVTAGSRGSPLYMAPEQFRGETVSAETDVYALGLVAYEMIAGKPPFPLGDPGYHHVYVAAEPLLNCSPHVGAAVLRALAKQRSERFPSAMAFLEALSRADTAESAGTRRAAPPPPPRRVDPPPRVNPPPPVFPPIVYPPPTSWKFQALVAVLVSAAMGLLGWLAWTRGNAWWRDHEPDTVLTIKLESVPAPYVSELPAAVENAPDPQLPAEPGEVVGARNPHVLWRANYGSHVNVYLAGIGGDGTTYLTASSHVWALRDGRLQWGYSDIQDGRDEYPMPRLRMGPDGRVWFASGFVFNRDGQGGRLKSAFQLPPGLKTAPYKPYESRGPPPRFHCVKGVGDANWHAAGPGLEGRDDQGKRWFVSLDHDCEEFVVTRNGDVYATTATKSVYRIDLSGQVRWIWRALCTNPVLRSLPSGDLIVVCVNEPVQCVRHGRLLWTFTGGRVRDDMHGHTELPGIEVDKAGTTYFSDFSLGRPAQFYAVDMKGNLKWKLRLGDMHVDELQFGKAGRIYVVGDGSDGANRGTGIICLGD